MAIRARFTGDGSGFHQGIPATDLSEDEYQALDVEQRKIVRESPLYKTKTDAEMRGGDAPAPRTASARNRSRKKPAATPAPAVVPEPDVVAVMEPDPEPVWTPTPPADERPEDIAF